MSYPTLPYLSLPGLMSGEGLPSEDDVRYGIVFGGGSLVGNLRIPTEAFVKLGYNYGTGGIEFTGQLNTTITIQQSTPTESQQFDSDGLTELPGFTGTTQRANDAPYIDYLDRKVDVLAFRGAKVQGDTLLDQSLLDDESGGEVCVGVQKLAQAWVLEFLTEQGSVPYGAERGSRFMIAVRTGRLLTELDVFQYFNLASTTVSRNLSNAETDEDPDDERFADARLTGVVIAPGLAVLHVTITSLAGNTRRIILPIPSVP